MSRIQVATGPLAICAHLVDEEETGLRLLGVQVDFHPGVVRAAHMMTLEAALRGWKREIGAVWRGAAVQRRGPCEYWLPGWTIKAFQQGTAIRLDVAYRELGESSEAGPDVGIFGDDAGAEVP